MRERDVQKSRVYRAENELCRILDQVNASGGSVTMELLGSQITLSSDIRFGSVEHVQMYVNRVLADPDVRALYPWATRKPVTVRHRKGNAKAHYRKLGGELAVHEAKTGQSWALREIVVLHELAHHVVATDYPDTRTGASQQEVLDGRIHEVASSIVASHGDWFARTYLNLVRIMISHETAFALEIFFRQEDVKIAIR